MTIHKPYISSSTSRTGRKLWWVEDIGPGKAFAGPFYTEEEANDYLKKFHEWSDRMGDTNRHAK
jgi:hypothetical protein